MEVAFILSGLVPHHLYLPLLLQASNRSINFQPNHDLDNAVSVNLLLPYHTLAKHSPHILPTTLHLSLTSHQNIHYRS